MSNFSRVCCGYSEHGERQATVEATGSKEEGTHQSASFITRAYVKVALSHSSRGRGKTALTHVALGPQTDENDISSS